MAVSSLLGETSSLQDYGTAIVHNFSAKEVKSVVSTGPIRPFSLGLFAKKMSFTQQMMDQFNKSRNLAIITKLIRQYTTAKSDRAVHSILSSGQFHLAVKFF